MSFVKLETDSRASPGAVSSGRTAAKRVSVQQSRPSWQPDGFRCSDCGRSRPGFPVLAVRVSKRRGQIALSVVFTTKCAGKPSVRRCRWSLDCTETRFAANAPAKTAPKRVFLPLGAPALHQNPPRALGGCATSYTKVPWLHARGPAFYSSWDPAGAIGTSHSATMAPVPDGCQAFPL